MSFEVPQMNIIAQTNDKPAEKPGFLARVYTRSTMGDHFGIEAHVSNNKKNIKFVANFNDPYGDGLFYAEFEVNRYYVLACSDCVRIKVNVGGAFRYRWGQTERLEGMSMIDVDGVLVCSMPNRSDDSMEYFNLDSDNNSRVRQFMLEAATKMPAQ